jgi:hypothetical protein
VTAVKTVQTFVKRQTAQEPAVIPVLKTVIMETGAADSELTECNGDCCEDYTDECGQACDQESCAGDSEKTCAQTDCTADSKQSICNK